MKLVIYLAPLGLGFNWFCHDGRLFVVLHVAVWSMVAFQRRNESC